MKVEEMYPKQKRNYTKQTWNTFSQNNLVTFKKRWINLIFLGDSIESFKSEEIYLDKKNLGELWLLNFAEFKLCYEIWMNHYLMFLESIVINYV